MGRVIRFMRGTTTENQAYTGPSGSITYDEDTNTLLLHNGSMAGGFPVITRDVLDELRISELSDISVSTPANSQILIYDEDSDEWVNGSYYNDVVIRRAEDFPEPNMDNEIELLPNTVYTLVGEINIGNNRLILSNNTTLKSYGEMSSSLVSSTTGILLNGQGCSFRINNISIDAPAAQVYGFSCLAGDAVARITNVNVNASTLGTIDNYREFSIRGGGLINLNGNGLTLIGTFSRLSLSKLSIERFDGVLIDLDEALFRRIDIKEVDIDTSSTRTNTLIRSDLPNGGNLISGGLAFVMNNNVYSSDDTNPPIGVVGVSPGDSGWFFTNNSTIPDSKRSGTIELLGNTTETTITTVGEYTIPEGTTALDSALSQRFIQSDNFKLQYIDDKIFYGFTFAQISCFKAGGSPEDYSFRLYRTRDSVTEPVGVPVTVSIRNVTTSITLTNMIQVFPDDHFELRVACETSTTGITIRDMQFNISER